MNLDKELKDLEQTIKFIKDLQEQIKESFAKEQSLTKTHKIAHLSMFNEMKEMLEERLYISDKIMEAFEGALKENLKIEQDKTKKNLECFKDLCQQIRSEIYE